MTKVPLSKRVRPNSEVPQYVYDEIVALETERDEARAEVARLRGLIAECRRCCSECSPRSECQTCRWLREGTEARR